MRPGAVGPYSSEQMAFCVARLDGQGKRILKLEQRPSCSKTPAKIWTPFPNYPRTFAPDQTCTIRRHARVPDRSQTPGPGGGVDLKSGTRACRLIVQV